MTVDLAQADALLQRSAEQGTHASAALAAVPTTSNRSCRSDSRSPLSARPGSGSKSRPTSMS